MLAQERPGPGYSVGVGFAVAPAGGVADGAVVVPRLPAGRLLRSGRLGGRLRGRSAGRFSRRPRRGTAAPSPRPGPGPGPARSRGSWTFTVRTPGASAHHDGAQPAVHDAGGDARRPTRTTADPEASRTPGAVTVACTTTRRAPPAVYG